jgi:hypothetical protein
MGIDSHCSCCLISCSTCITRILGCRLDIHSACTISHRSCINVVLVIHLFLLASMDNLIIRSNSPFPSVRCTSLVLLVCYSHAVLCRGFPDCSCLVLFLLCCSFSMSSCNRRTFIDLRGLVKGVFSVLLARRISTKHYVGNFCFD